MGISADCTASLRGSSCIQYNITVAEKKQKAGLGELELDQNTSIRLIVVMHKMHRVANMAATLPKAFLKLPAPVKC